MGLNVLFVRMIILISKESAINMKKYLVKIVKNSQLIQLVASKYISVKSVRIILILMIINIL